VFYFCQFLGADVSVHHAFLYPLEQLLEHFVPLCPVLVCILSKLIVLLDSSNTVVSVVGGRAEQYGQR